MINRKMIMTVLIWIVAMFYLLLLFSCQARRPSPISPMGSAAIMVSATPSPTVLATIAVGGIPATIPVATLADEPPIIVVTTDYHDGQSGKTTIRLTCLNDNKYHREIDTEDVCYLSGLIMDDDENIYVAVGHFDPSDLGGSSIYIVPRHGSIKRLDLDVSQISSFQYSHSKIVFAGQTTLGGKNTIVILGEDFSYKIVKLESVESWKACNIGGIVTGEGHKVIVFDDQPIEKNEKQFAVVFIIDLDSGEVTSKFLSVPPSENSVAPLSPTVKYNLLCVGVSKDLKILYYSYSQVKEAGGDVLYPGLGMFDTENGKELHTYSKCCPPLSGYQQHKEYLFVGCSAEGGGTPLLLSTQDLSPVVDLGELLRGKREETSTLLLSPFGKYFVVGTHSKVFLLSQDGHILKEYPLPPDLIGNDYAIVKYPV